MNPRRPMSAISRREVLGTLAASLAAPALLRAKGRGRRLPIAFSTLGCPGWTWPTVLDQADRLGYAGIELRGIQGDMDLTKRPELTGDGLKRTRRDLEARGIVVTDLGASAHMHEKDPALRTAQLDEGRRFIDLAHALRVPYVRTLGDKLPPDEPKEDALKRIVDGFQQMAAYAKPAGRSEERRVGTECRPGGAAWPSRRESRRRGCHAPPPRPPPGP